MREREGREGGAQQGTCHRSAQIQPGSFGSGDEYTARVKAFTVFFWVFTRESDGDLTNEASSYRSNAQENFSHDSELIFITRSKKSCTRYFFTCGFNTNNTYYVESTELPHLLDCCCSAYHSKDIHSRCD